MLPAASDGFDVDDIRTGFAEAMTYAEIEELVAQFVTDAQNPGARGSSEFSHRRAKYEGPRMR